MNKYDVIIHEITILVHIFIYKYNKYPCVMYAYSTLLVLHRKY